MQDDQPSSKRHAPLWRFGRKLPAAGGVDRRPAFEQADPRWIRGALQRAQALPSGGWYALDASRAITSRPRCLQVAGRALVAWRAGERLLVAPNACPHMGASLAAGRVERGRLLCPWHGLALGPGGHAGWRPLPSHDDGVLFWVRLDGGEPPSERPALPARPARCVDAVIRVEAGCEPQDVIANRLDPWHGVCFHPASFASLRVIDQRPDEITARVAYRVLGALAVEVDARFHCTDPRTIVMTIVRGEGEGSVVETHATPLAPGRTAIVEATLASSERAGFLLAAQMPWLLRALIARAARRLWVDDAAYAERLHALRAKREPERGELIALRALR